LRGKKTGILGSNLHVPLVPKMLGIENYTAYGDETHLTPAAQYDGKLKIMWVQFLLHNLYD